MTVSSPVERAVEDAHSWVGSLGPSWIARFDQMHCEIRRWADEVGVDPHSHEFRAAWCVATTFLHRMARLMDVEVPGDGGELAHAANILASVGLWGWEPLQQELGD